MVDDPPPPSSGEVAGEDEPSAALWERALRHATRHDFVPPTDAVALDVRRHPVVLLVPGVRTAAALVAMLTGLALVPLLVFSLATLQWGRQRASLPLQRAGGLAVAATLVLVVLGGHGAAPLARLVCLLALTAWLLEDVLDWLIDRLVVTNKRVYRPMGVLTRHAPSIALTGVAFLDPAVPPLGRLLGYGTLRLDSAAQRDAPLSQFDHVPDVVGVSIRILALRAAAMPRFPPPGM